MVGETVCLSRNVDDTVYGGAGNAKLASPCATISCRRVRLTVTSAGAAHSSKATHLFTSMVSEVGDDCRDAVGDGTGVIELICESIALSQGLASRESSEGSGLDKRECENLRLVGGHNVSRVLILIN